MKTGSFHILLFNGTFHKRIIILIYFLPENVFIYFIMHPGIGSEIFSGTFHVDKIHVWFKIANITHALLVPVYRQTDFTPKWVVLSRLHDTIARFHTGVNSHRSARTGVNTRRGDSRRHNILWWYHVNKYRAMRGNRSELAPGQKSTWCHVNSP